MFDFPRLQTPRVNLRLLTLDDAEAVRGHFSDPEVTRFMDIDPVQDLAEAREIIAWHLEDTGCRWGLFCRATQILIGTCGFHAWRRDGVPTAEIGFDLSRAYWGIGLMREVLPPVLEVGFRDMTLARVEAHVEPANARSIALVKALGFARDRELPDGLVAFVLERARSNPPTP